MVLQCSSLASLLVLVIPRAGSYNQYAPVGGEYPNQPSPTAIQLDAMNFTSTKQFNEHGKWWYGEGDIFPWYGKLAGHKELYHPVRSACYGGTQNGFCKDENTNVVAAKYAPPSSSSSSNTTGDGHRQRRERRERALLTARDTARDTAGRGVGRGVGNRRLGASSVGALSTAKFVTDAKPQDCLTGLAASLTAKSSGESGSESSGVSSGVKKGRRMAAASSVASGVEEAYDPVRCILDGNENPLLCHEVRLSFCCYILYYILYYIQCYVQVAVDII